MGSHTSGWGLALFHKQAITTCHFSNGRQKRAYCSVSTCHEGVSAMCTLVWAAQAQGVAASPVVHWEHFGCPCVHADGKTCRGDGKEEGGGGHQFITRATKVCLTQRQINWLNAAFEAKPKYW